MCLVPYKTIYYSCDHEKESPVTFDVLDKCDERKAAERTMDAERLNVWLAAHPLAYYLVSPVGVPEKCEKCERALSK